MKKNEKPSLDKNKRNTTKCMICGQCDADQNEEKGETCSDAKYEAKALYGAEVLTYYFYFVRGATVVY